MPTDKELEQVIDDLASNPETIEYVRRRIEDQDRRLDAIERALKRLAARQQQEAGDER